MEKVSSSKSTLEESDRHKYYRSHLVQYTLVLITFVVSIWIIAQASETIWKLVGIAFLSIFYFAFGVFHHWEEGEVSPTHILEYFLISAVIFVILFSLFLR